MLIVILTMTLKVIIENRLTSSCRFSPLRQQPIAAQLSYSYQTLMMKMIVIALVMMTMMIIMHSDNDDHYHR